MKINEQIAALRKQKGITQENLAQALGVTNQSVSKWESGQCCPDIQLLPEIAKYFEISIDELMGEKPQKTECDSVDLVETAPEINDPLLMEALELLGGQRLISTAVLQRKMGIGYLKAKELIDEMQSMGYIIELKPGFYRLVQSKQDFVRTFVKSVAAKNREDILNVALAMHAVWFFKAQKSESTIDSAVDAVVNGQWGYSAFSESDMTTVMRGQSVFYSKNKCLDLNDERIDRLCVLMKVLSNRDHLRIWVALYELTVHEEQAYASVEKIAEKSKLSAETVLECLNEHLFPYLRSQNKQYRIKGEAMATLPILSILCY